MSIKLGFVGLSAGYSWAGTSHLPGLQAIKSSPYKITGVVNTSEASLKANIEKNKLVDATGHASVASLAQDSNVNTVVVSVKVPHHGEFVTEALNADKDVICEWPLGNGLAEAEDLVKLASAKGVKTGVVLQARKSPTIIKAKELIAGGAIGRVISTNFIGHHQSWGQFFGEGYGEYLLNEKNGATMVSIVGGHDLDAIAYVLGEFEWLNAYLTTQFPQVNVVKTDYVDKKMTKTGKTIQRDVADQMVVQGKLLSGAVASIHIRGQQTSDLMRQEGLRWEIHGSKGDIVITSDSAYAELSLLSIKMSQLDENGNSGAVVDLTVPYNPVSDNLKEFYQSYAQSPTGVKVPAQLDAVNGYTTFEDALIRHKQIQAIYDSSKSGSRISYI